MSRIIVVVFCVALIASACTDPVAPPAPTPVVPTVTDTFTGTLSPLATNSHPFVVSAIGGVKVTLTTVDPPVKLAIGIGTPSTTTGTCAVITSTITVPSTTPQLSGTATIAGNYCVAVSDPGNVTDTAAYTITVLHS